MKRSCEGGKAEAEGDLSAVARQRACPPQRQSREGGKAEGARSGTGNIFAGLLVRGVVNISAENRVNRVTVRQYVHKIQKAAVRGQ